jgi:long-chain acyl-CoA synthetase
LIVRSRSGAGSAARLGRRRGDAAAASGRADSDSDSDSDRDIHVPSAIATAGKRGLALAQRLLYRRVLDTRVTGANHVPHHTHFIVVANHCSHLDMGLIKVALGDAGRDLTSLAAADYFFRNKYRRAYFKHFTNLVPMERTGSIRKSMDTAERVLRRGRSMVVFPEGTRSMTGEMADFLPSLGYLALRAEVGLLPAYISGTYESMPKGAAVPKSRDLGVAFGPFISHERLQELTAGLPQQEAWRLVAAYAQRIIESLRDGVPHALDLPGARAAWDGHKLGEIADRRAGGETSDVAGDAKKRTARRRALRSVP